MASAPEGRLDFWDLRANTRPLRRALRDKMQDLGKDVQRIDAAAAESAIQQSMERADVALKAQAAQGLLARAPSVAWRRWKRSEDVKDRKARGLEGARELFEQVQSRAPALGRRLGDSWNTPEAAMKTSQVSLESKDAVRRSLFGPARPRVVDFGGGSRGSGFGRCRGCGSVCGPRAAGFRAGAWVMRCRHALCGRCHDSADGRCLACNESKGTPFLDLQ